MKRFTFAASLLVAGIIGYGVAVYAQPGGSKGDPTKVDSKHYKVELENESVRVLRVKYGPGEKSVMHYHPNLVAVYITDGKVRMTMPDGKTTDQTAKAGGAVWAPAGSHLPQNTGDKPFEIVLVELKK